MRVNNKKIMEKFTKSKLVAQIAITSFVAALAIVGVAYATTIGTNISTGGTLSVSLNSTMATTTISGGDLIVDTDTLVVDNDNNRVGVGTTTPGYLLDVDGDVRIGESGNANALTIDAGTGAIVINDDGAATADVRVEGNTKTDLFMIDASADRVGIGSTTPSALFSVGVTGSVSSATSTIDFAKPCFRMMTENGTMLYLYLKLNANAYSNWATSTNSCF